MENCQDLIIDERIWQEINDPTTADSIACELFALKEAIDGGPDGAKEASETILANIKAAYLHRRAQGRAQVVSLISYRTVEAGRRTCSTH